MKLWKKYIIKVSVFIFILAVDLITKSLLDGVQSSFLSPFISIFSTHNYGVGWSILEGKTALIIGLTLVFFVLLCVFDFFSRKRSLFLHITNAFLLSGALGNIIDRIAFGYVRDFLKFDFINFPIFNVADIALTFGVVLMIIYVLFLEKKDSQEKQKNVQEENKIIEKGEDNN